MYYSVKGEAVSKDMKERFTIGQIINEVEINKLKFSLKNYLFNSYEDCNELNLEFYDKNMFNEKVFKYSVSLQKHK